MTTEQQFALVTIVQPAAALASNLFVHMGWRPGAVWLFTNDMGTKNLLQIDNARFAVDNDRSLAFGLAAAQAVEDNGIEITDTGFILGSHGAIRDANTRITCLVFRPLAAHHVVELPANAADLPVMGKTYGDGKQFDATTDRGSIAKDGPNRGKPTGANTGGVTSKRSDLGAFGVYRVA